MDKNELLANYLVDLIFLLKENALEAKKRYQKEKDDYTSGHSFAYYEVISLIQQQAKAFEIDLKDINLGDIDADKDLLIPK